MSFTSQSSSLRGGMHIVEDILATMCTCASHILFYLPPLFLSLFLCSSSLLSLSLSLSLSEELSSLEEEVSVSVELLSSTFDLLDLDALLAESGISVNLKNSIITKRSR